MWLNAFACVRPTDELKRQIGEYVLRLLNDPECTILCDYDQFPAFRSLNQRELVVRFNKS